MIVVSCRYALGSVVNGGGRKGHSLIFSNSKVMMNQLTLVYILDTIILTS